MREPISATQTRQATAVRPCPSSVAVLLAPQRQVDPAPRPTESPELDGSVFEGRLERKCTKIGGRGFDFPALEFQHMTELEMGICDIPGEIERFSVGILGLCEVTGLLQRMAVLHPYRRIMRLLIKGLAVIAGRRRPVARISR